MAMVWMGHCRELDAITDVLQVMLNMCVPFYTNSREQQTT
eukprot:CAMPEP_0177760966 /NCGR_PEP_ID=MMETSP0491_2-20121128/5550_1 /TAXON_ID=63592 /ORGANISM="Tetraselmis chuii, Strain PLY429" /LENGTH=39 /DNA_ID= /DNA_START= /DNA_END= /DNA_ORIENTATION=